MACGDTNFPAHYGIDIYPGHNVDIQADITHLPFRDGSIEAIECHQAIEHFFPEDSLALFGEWARVLKSGGMIHISTPDFRYVAREFLEGRMHIHIARAYICGTTEMNTFKRDQPESYHRTLWDVLSLSQELTASGFNDIQCKNEAWNLHITASRN